MPQDVEPSDTPLTVGDIVITGDSILTPRGSMPLPGAIWVATDKTKTERYIPVYATVLALVLALPTCLISLLFLLISKQSVTGYTQVAVHSGGSFYQTEIPASATMNFEEISAMVDLLRRMSATLATTA
ncbi:hypothetical protein [Glycomyces terrestris]|uniref:Uncharacterized protein n=1 Tax=Glycomyces terrestris TaxID=2493553 RepID=A0A426V3L5_9ACTN|nr:hypothetical protein [Glycomyces terrestris]RRS01499.1 hypothetical protein EIW28_01650 [Glycomyces terrestris]